MLAVAVLAAVAAVITEEVKEQVVERTTTTTTTMKTFLETPRRPPSTFACALRQWFEVEMEKPIAVTTMRVTAGQGWAPQHMVEVAEEEAAEEAGGAMVMTEETATNQNTGWFESSWPNRFCF
jgi:hypothetical protein